MNKSKLSRYWRRWFLIVLVLSMLFTAVCISSLRTADYRMMDIMFQHPATPSEDIIIIGIDSYSLESIGTWPWDRKVIADLVNLLNEDPKTRPAAIGIDIMYNGYTSKESDQALVEAASAGNVVTSCMGEFSGAFVKNPAGDAYLDNFKPTLIVKPFLELARVTRVGHVNAMYDSDGILRHHLWSIKDLNNCNIMSFPYQMVQLYCNEHELPGNFVPSQNKQGFWWLNYKGLPGSYTMYSVQDILDGNYDPDAMKGAMVFIGSYDTGLSDDFVTAVDRSDRMYGVEYMANVAENMLDGKVYVEVDSMPQLLFLLIYGVIMGFLLFMLPLKWSFLLFVGGMITDLLLSYWMYLKGNIEHPLWIPAILIIVFISCICEHYTMADKDRASISTIFERYVDSSVMNELMKEDVNSLKLSGRTMNIAVLFVDIRGFTALSEGMDPEQVVHILDEYLTLTSKCIKKNGGTLDKFIGDCTMAIWGAPLPTEDPVYKAACAAMDMVAGSDELAKRLMAKYGKTVSFGIGIHYGPAVVGNIGSPERLDYTAVGDTVNTASRLEAQAEGGKIYISNEVMINLGNRAKVTNLGTLMLKGKTRGIEAYTLDELLK